jgi:predicted secreted protein
MRTALLTLSVCVLALPANAQYSGGTGEPNDPYQIATAADLIALGETPEDYNKHFILTADIDLEPNLPGRKVFDRAVIAPGWKTWFMGVFDGRGHSISNLTITGESDLVGLFGRLGPDARVSNLGLEAVEVSGSGDYVGGLVGYNYGGSITTSYSSGSVSGTSRVGGLVGFSHTGRIIDCHSSGLVSGSDGYIGGLVGSTFYGSITTCHSTGSVSGDWGVGGLVGSNGEDDGRGCITDCYSTGSVSGRCDVGGLVGINGDWYGGLIANSYSTGAVTGGGGLVGDNTGWVVRCFWDIETSGQMNSAAGTGKTTAEMQDIETFLSVGWDFVDETPNGTCDYWQMTPGEYPRLLHHGANRPLMPEGLGTAEQPYLIRDARDLGTVWREPFAYYRLVESLDLSGSTWSRAVIPWFEGDFDGNGCVIRNLHIQGGNYLGLFGELGPAASVSNLGLETVEVSLAWDYVDVPVFDGGYVGGLVGLSEGVVTQCCSTGSVSVSADWNYGHYCVGGLVGETRQGSMTNCHSSASVSAMGISSSTGGLVGDNKGNMTDCHSSGLVSGSNWYVGGLVGENWGSISASYSSGSVSGTDWSDGAGGLVGRNRGSIATSYNSGSVSATSEYSPAGGLVARNSGSIAYCHSSGSVSGSSDVGGLTGENSGSIATSYCTGAVRGTDRVGGFVGDNRTCYGCDSASITTSYSTGVVSGSTRAGGLVGDNTGRIVNSYASSSVSGHRIVGGLAGSNGSIRPWGGKESGEIVSSYSTGVVSGASDVGGLVGLQEVGPVIASFWDIQTSARTTSSGGTGKTTVEMQTASTFLDAGWDFVGETANGAEDTWKIAEGLGYPRLSWEKYSGGTGEQNDPYQIATAADLITLGETPDDYGKHFILTADIDLDPNLPGRRVFDKAVIAPTPSWSGGTPFTGVFDGRGHTISNLTIMGEGYLGLLGNVGLWGAFAEIRNLGLFDVNIFGSGSCVGGLAGCNWGGNVSRCYSTGVVSGSSSVGGLAGCNWGGNGGDIATSYAIASVSGGSSVGGLVGLNADGGTVCNSYTSGSVNGDSWVGGLVGMNDRGRFHTSYSTSRVCGNTCVGGLVGDAFHGIAGFWLELLFWDIETSGQTASAGGTGKTTAEMQTASTFLDAGWDFMGETANGTEDIWKIAEGLDYPRVWWEPYDGQVTVVLGRVFTVTLESNPSTGYRWEWVDHQDSIVEQMGEAQFKPRETGDPPLVGAGGWESFDFKAVHPGQMTLKLVYRRPWEEGVEPLKTFSLQVTVH